MSDNIFFNIADLKKCGKNVIIGKTVRIRHPELVEIGDNSIIDDFTLISGRVIIGSYVHIASSCTIQAGGSKVSIGDFSGISSGVRVFATSSDYIRCSFDSACLPKEVVYGSISKDIVFKDHVWIGANSVVLPGAILPIGFTCAAMTKLEGKNNYKPWTVFSTNPLFECRRIFKNKLLASVEILKNKYGNNGNV
jgi:acetyltransferase-like isoleucine patch superfamily enzyme